jgi:hypothetical protein
VKLGQLPPNIGVRDLRECALQTQQNSTTGIGMNDGGILLLFLFLFLLFTSLDSLFLLLVEHFLASLLLVEQ